MKKPETTSKKVASKSGKLLKEIDETIRGLHCAVTVIVNAMQQLEDAKSAIASALTQSPDKKK